jgi:hypothetical protein
MVVLAFREFSCGVSHTKRVVRYGLADLTGRGGGAKVGIVEAKVSRIMVAACVVAAVGFSAACGAGPDDAGDADAAENGPSKKITRASDDAKERAPAPGQNRDEPLTKAQLERAALTTGDLKGFKVAEMPASDILEFSVPADPAVCQPIADMFLFTTAPPAEAAVGRTFTANDELDPSTTSLALLSYPKGDAGKVLSGLRTATRKCTAYEHTDYQYTGVKALADPDLGDESVAYRLLTSIDGIKAPATFTVVRSGTTLVSFTSMAMLDPEEVVVPSEIIEGQLEKLGSGSN